MLYREDQDNAPGHLRCGKTEQIATVSVFKRAWPIAGLAVSLLVTLAWIILLGYGLLRITGLNV